MYLLLCVIVCVHRSDTVQTLLFSLSHLVLYLLFLLPLFPHPPLKPHLLNKGKGKFYLHFFENVIIIIIIIMIVLMTIIVSVKIKGGVSERVSSNWGEEMSAL